MATVNGKRILADGRVEGETFSGPNYHGEKPRAKRGESYRDYRKRVDKCVEEGFDLGDLGNYDWQCYCKGSGNFAGVSSYDII